jgi:hypothetical protein
MAINYTALTMQVTQRHIKAFRSGSASLNMTTYLAILYGVIVIVGVFASLTLVGQPGNNFLGLVLPVVVIVGSVYGIHIYQKAKTIRDIRISTFATDNNFFFIPVIDDPGFAGMYFDVGDSRVASYTVGGDYAGAQFEIANYQYMTGSGKNRSSHRLGYIRIRLDRQLPHIVLDAVKNNMKLFGLQASNLPVAFQRDQRMQLEGNFNDYFNLYAPRGYERDALYVFTPDLMALFIDFVNVYDAEIIDDELFIYTPSEIQFKNTTYMEHIFKIIEVVGMKTIGRTDRYQDERTERVSPNTVAFEGQRLKRSTIAITLLMVFALCFVAFHLLIAYNIF